MQGVHPRALALSPPLTALSPLAAPCSPLLTSQPCLHRKPCLRPQLPLHARTSRPAAAVPPQSNLQQAGWYPQHAGDGPRMLEALPTRAEPLTLRAGLATELVCGERASEEGWLGQGGGAPASRGPSQLPGLPAPGAGSAGLLY